MTVRDKQTLKGYFTNGSVPNEEEYADLIDSLMDGTQVGIDLSKILLIVPSTLTITEYPPTNIGFADAITASSSGDEILIPPVTILDDHIIPADVLIRGQSRRHTTLAGLITLSAGSILDNLRCTGATIGPPDNDVLTVTQPAGDFGVIEGDGTRKVTGVWQGDITSGGLFNGAELRVADLVTQGPKRLYWSISGAGGSTGGFGETTEVLSQGGDEHEDGQFIHADEILGREWTVEHIDDTLCEVDQWNYCLAMLGQVVWTPFLSTGHATIELIFSLDPLDAFFGSIGVIGPSSGKAFISNCDVVVYNQENNAIAIQQGSGQLDIIDSYLCATTLHGHAWDIWTGSGYTQVFHSRLHADTTWFTGLTDVYVYSVVEGGYDV